MASHRVAILALDAVLPLDLGIPAQIFSRARMPYRLTVCGIEPGPVTTPAGFSLSVPGGLADVARADTIIVPGFRPHDRLLPPAVLEVLVQARDRGGRVVSICTGTFALAAAGVLDGLRATTHWNSVDELATSYPQIAVEENVLYVDEGNILTSAGVSSGIDLCLHIIRRDLGALAANEVARAIVAAPHRDGGQAQFIERPLPGSPDDPLAATRTWALTQLDRPLTVRELAQHARVSDRTLARHFLATTGISPIQWLLRARLDQARGLLEQEALTVQQIAQRCGLGTPANFRLHFRRLVGCSPSAYRSQFRHSTDGTDPEFPISIG